MGLLPLFLYPRLGAIVPQLMNEAVDMTAGFAEGQRWISVGEPELGLGLVVRLSPGQVQLLFPGAGENRCYAADHAPLKRVRFAVGDRVSCHEGDELTVVSVSEDDGLLRYFGADGNSIVESLLCDSLSLDDPEQRLLSGHIDSSALFDLRLATLKHRYMIQRSPVRGFLGGRIELLPHQLYIAHEVSKRHLPRVLLADEVGLGKTIEASLIIHRMLVCGSVQRVLILVPSPLIHQWFVELLRRFNLPFAIVDESRCEEAREVDGANPFLDEQLVLCGLDMLATNRSCAKQALSAGWDMVVVDEAHHLRWSEEGASSEYQLVEAFAKSAAGLLLLTASPEQAGVAGHFARLRLLDPARYASFKSFVAEHDGYADVARHAEALLSSSSQDELTNLLDRHGPGRVMFHNTRAAMSTFPKRIPHLVPLTMSGEGGDARVDWLAGFIRDNPSTKMLVMCDSATEVIALREALLRTVGTDIAMFHEELPLIQCDRQAAWFADEDGPRVLMTSGIGGEGRNFQHVQHLVLMDLPDDPELVEQRIGRLDRIGQAHDIHIHVPYIVGTGEADWVRWLHEGLDAFATPLVGGYRMLLGFADRVGSVTNKLISDTRAAHKKLCSEIATGRDRLLELNSCRQPMADELAELIRTKDCDGDLREYMSEVFEHFGVGVEVLAKNDLLLLPDALYCDDFPLPRGDSMRMTYDRNFALSRPTTTLLSWDHPMVHGAMDLILGMDRGRCAVSLSHGYQGVMLQAVFVLESVSSHRLALGRFLPPTPIVVQVDSGLESVEALPKIDGDGESWRVLEDESLRLKGIPAMLVAARALAEERSELLRNGAKSEIAEEMQHESRRLRELQLHNDHVRDEEIAAVDLELVELADAMSEARLRLDAIRVVFGTVAQ